MKKETEIYTNEQLTEAVNDLLNLVMSLGEALKETQELTLLNADVSLQKRDIRALKKQIENLKKMKLVRGNA